MGPDNKKKAEVTALGKELKERADKIKIVKSFKSFEEEEKKEFKIPPKKPAVQSFDKAKPKYKPDIPIKKGKSAAVAYGMPQYG